MHDELGQRMKDFEKVGQTSLTPKVPVIIRVDGKAFHTFTRNYDRPYDKDFAHLMHQTALYLCGHIQGCQLAYTQSDEISLLLTDYQTIQTQAFFGYERDKMVSVTAGMASSHFMYQLKDDGINVNHLPCFDCRVFSLPREECCNYFVWRQADATRNSIQMLGQAHFSHKELQGMPNRVIQEMLFTQKGINWDACETPQKRGVAIVKVRRDYEIPRVVSATTQTGTIQVGTSRVSRLQWEIDLNIPIFTQDRQYIEKWVNLEQ